MLSRYVNFVDMSTPDDPITEIWIRNGEGMPHKKMVRQSLYNGIWAADIMKNMFAVAYSWKLYNDGFRIESEYKTWFEAIQNFAETITLAYSRNKNKEDFQYRLILLHKRNGVAYVLAEAHMTNKGIWKYKYKESTPCPYDVELELPF